MKLIKFLLSFILIMLVGSVFSQQLPVKTTEIQTKTNLTDPAKKNNIKSVPKAQLQQSQLKKITQTKQKIQAQKLKTAIRKSNMVRKKGKK
ncbi:MAG: hypothetical protein CVU00_07365 [Bacteroidetes bacterium HGW-Bacteroidetes-17]|nr:MAG: hypothetical protein CVU00_07365 [Bacteroidetes bacterium HGW-Bacteroidetes-17]